MFTGLMFSCADTANGPDHEPPTPPATTGNIEVTVSTTGNGTDEDGYSVMVNGESKSLEMNGTAMFNDIEKGTYDIELSGVGSGCVIEGDNPVSVTVIVEETVTAAFSVVCEQAKTEGIITFSQTMEGQFEIFTMKADGTNQKQVTSYKLQDQNPAISPDGKRIVFVRQDSESSTLDNDIWVMDIDGSNPTLLTDNTVDDKRPVWSPDGTQIAFESGRDSFSIWVMNADGSSKTQITDDMGNDTSPTWTSADNTIAFVSDRQGDDSSDIYVVKPNGAGLDILVDANNENGINLFNPEWSPDGTKLAYQGFSSSGAGRIFVANMEDANVQMIQADGYSNARQPSWSPDGDYITFLELGSATNTDAIWIVEKDGDNPIKLTGDKQERLAFPNWGIALE